MNIIERQKLIMEKLEAADCLTVEEIAELTGASLPTVRRDLNVLAAEHGLVRFRGGIGFSAKAPSMTNFANKANWKLVTEDSEYMATYQLEVEREKKIKIAKKAAEYVENGDVIYVDNSTTVYYMNEFLKGKDVMVVANGLDMIFKLLEHRIPAYVLNGQVNQEAHCILGGDTEEQLKKMNFNKVFIGTRGIDEASGFTTTDNYDSVLKKIAIAKAEQCYVLTDSSKFFQRRLYTYARLDEATIITDDTNGFSSAAAQIVLCD